MKRDLREGRVWISCSCGKEHLLKSGIGAPIYWCGDELRKLCIGDEIETEDNIDYKVTEKIHKLGLKFSREILNEGCLLLPCQMQRRFYEKWDRYSLLN